MIEAALVHSEVTQPAPEGSFVVVADVRGSTKAIAAGRQRDVNLVGAACVAAVRNAFPEGTVPYVFGGDGATFLVSSENLAKLEELLFGVQKMALDNLQLSLRVGHVSVAELRASNADVRVGTMRSGEEEQVYLLRGEGLLVADAWVKERDTVSSQIRSLHPIAQADLSGLSCRLLPFESLRGRMCSFIVECHLNVKEQDEIFTQLFSHLDANGGIERFRPLQKKNIRRQWLPRTWRLEGRFFSVGVRWGDRIASFLKAFIENILTKFVFQFDKENGMTGLPSTYTERLLLQCDWLKLNGSFYLILDMNEHEYQSFKAELDHFEAKGKILYGVHRSSAALIICHLNSKSQKKHFHFVDGSEGGLTAAAAVLKEKKKRLASV